MAARTDLERTLESMIRDIVKSGEVVDVLFERGEEVPYEDMLKVRVLYRSKGNILDVEETIKVARDLWSKMAELRDPAFPHVQFIPSKEWASVIAAQ